MAVATARAAAKKKAKKQSPTWWKWTKRTFVLLSTFFFIGASIFGYMFYQAYQVAAAKVVNLDDLTASVDRSPSVIFSADGKKLYEISAEYRKPVRYEAIPENVRNAMLAAEDKRFFDHKGVDAIAIGRILFTNVKEQRAAQGGSTLTMQLAKLLYTNSEKSFKRKLGDMAMALAIEKKKTKEEIFELYMNKVYFGSGAHGIQAAADVYFNKTIDKLTIGEAALLARCVRRPSDQNPFRNPELAMDNRDTVLRTMLGEKMISQQEFDKAKAEKYNFKHQAEQVSERFFRSEYFVWHVLETLKRQHPDINLSEGGYKVYTTLDTTMQSVAEAGVRETIADHKRQGVTTAAFVAIDRDGRILCEVGGPSFKKNQFNVVTDGFRQPGSSFKPFIYSTALSMGVISLNDYVSNERFSWPLPGAVKPWTPKNSNGKYGGSVSIPTAFKFSMNVPMARVMEMVGPETARNFAVSNFNFSTDRLSAVPALCLGSGEVTPLQMAEAYSTFMLRGQRATPYCITRIIAPDGRVQVFGPDIKQTGLSPEVADQIDALMRLVIESGTGTRARVVPNARGKTGTTSDNKDAWFCGYADGVVGIGWIANETKENGRAVYRPMSGRVFGGTVTVEFWAKIMKYAQKRFGKQMERPSMSSVMSSSRPREDVNPDDIPTDVPEEDPPAEDPENREPMMLPGQPATDPGQNPTTAGGDGAQGPGPRPAQDVPPPTTTPVKSPRPPVDPPREDNLVDAEICADTGMRASIYCPETVTRRFAKGQEPRRRCTKHGGR